MRHSTTPKRDKARDHLQRMNIAIDEMLSQPMRFNAWKRLKILYERRDTAVRYLNRLRR